MTATAPARARARDNGVTSGVETITPKDAYRWLDGNTHNRGIVQADVDRIAGAITRGEWQLNGDAIRFAADGTLLDGQHRLWGIITADQPVRSLVVRGLRPEVQESMDVGRRRNLADVLKLRGEKDAVKLASVIRYWWRYQNGYVRQPGQMPTIPQALVVLEENPTLRSALKATEKLYALLRVPAGVSVACYYEFSSINQDQADAFLESLKSGIDLKEGSPILALRRYLELHRGAEAKPNAVVIHALTIKMWNAYRSGAKVARANWKATGMNAEGFPEAE